MTLHTRNTLYYIESKSLNYPTVTIQTKLLHHIPLCDINEYIVT